MESSNDQQNENIFFSSVYASLHYLQNSKRPRSEDDLTTDAKYQRTEDIHCQFTSALYENEKMNDDDYDNVIIGTLIPMFPPVETSVPNTACVGASTTACVGASTTACVGASTTACVGASTTPTMAPKTQNNNISQNKNGEINSPRIVYQYHNCKQAMGLYYDKSN